MRGQAAKAFALDFLGLMILFSKDACTSYTLCALPSVIPYIHKPSQDDPCNNPPVQGSIQQLWCGEEWGPQNPNILTVHNYKDNQGQHSSKKNPCQQQLAAWNQNQAETAGSSCINGICISKTALITESQAWSLSSGSLTTAKCRTITK